MRNRLQIFLSFMLSLLFFGEYVAVGNGNPKATTSFRVGVVLDLKSKVGDMAESCISIALSDFYNIYTNYTTRLVLHTMDSRGDVVDAASAALYLMKDVEVQAIIGPQESTQASFVIDLGEKAQVPIVSFSATSPSLSPLQNPYFVRTAIDDSTQVKAIAAVIQAFEWKEVVLIHEDTDYGNGLIPYFIDALQEIYVRVPYRISIPLDANDDQILNELHNMTTMQTRVFIVHMSSSIGSQLFVNANYAGMMSQGYAWIVSDGLSSSFAHMDSKTINSMEGVLGVRPYIPKSKELEEFKVKWKRLFYSNKSYGEISGPSLYGIWAYDTVWALAMAVEEVGTLGLQFLSSNTTDNLTDLSSLRYSPIGPQLLQTILSTGFKGLSGDFHFDKGQLNSSAFQIFNVIGEGERVIGYWTPMEGISRQLNTNKMTNPASHSNLKAIVWPGDSTTKPKGWAIPTDGQEFLRVLVPIKNNFHEFVNPQEPDPITDKAIINVTGYSIDVFCNAISRLPFDLPYQFYAYRPIEENFSYNELIDQVYFKVSKRNHLRLLSISVGVKFSPSAHPSVGLPQPLVVPWYVWSPWIQWLGELMPSNTWTGSLLEFDAAVGDVTIWANRSKYVDFTLPYSEPGVVMVVPMKENLEKEFWMFIKPLSLELWLVTIGGFIYVGFVVLILEHPKNKELGSTTQERLQTSLWYSFLTLVSERERIENNLTKAVLITWVFFGLILIQSYTASLSSMLTTQQLKPTITDVNEIQKNGYYVGYLDGSFVKDFLIEHLHLDKSKLKNYRTPEEYHDALSNRKVSAIFDELPYIQVFLNMYCNKYIKVGRTYSTEGFGFVFPKGSPLTSYMSTAILNLGDECGTLDKIKQRWLENHTNCDAYTTSTSSTQLTLKSFGGLFLIVGVSSGLSLLIHFFLFIGKWHAQTTTTSPISRWQKAGYQVIHMTNAVKRIRSITEVVSMESQPTDTDQHREVEMVEEGG